MSSASSVVIKDVDLYDDSDVTVRDETCPLLANQQSTVESQITQSKPTPVPKLQLTALCLVRILEPIGFTQLFPYINEMLVTYDMVSDPSQVGFVSGLVESTFAVFQMLSIYHWAKLSDVVGRRPVVLGGAIGMAIATSLFGLSRNLTAVMITRSLNGFFAGNIAVVQSVLGEISDASNLAITFPLYAMIWPLGATLGPLLGGTFSDPATKYPQLFDYPFFRENPYFFPCGIASVISCIGATVGYFILEETLPSKRRQTARSSASKSYGTAECQESSPVSAKSLLSIPIIRALSISGFALSFINAAFDTIFVLFCYTPIELGGIAFDTSQIGYALSMAGVMAVLMQIFLMPVLIRRSNHAKMYHLCMKLWFFPFLVLPFLNIIAINGLDESGKMLPKTEVLLWIGISIAICAYRFSCLAFSFSMIIIKDHTAGPSLSATNGLVNVAMSSARIFSPAIANSTFAVAVKLDLLGGRLWVVILVTCAIFGSYFSMKIVSETKRTHHT